MGNTENRVPEQWERQENESPQAFEAFAEYRNMGNDRSLAKVAERLGKSTPLMERWSRTHRWVARVEAWTDEQDRQTRENLSKGVTAMRKNHADIATAMLVKAAKALQRLPAEEMAPRDIATLVDVAAKLERLSRGEATERTEGRNEIRGRVTVASDPYEGLTTEELRKLVQLVDDSKT